MQLKNVMSRDVATVRPDTTLADCAETMRARDVGPLPVVDGSRVVGIVTDRDITTRAVAAGLDPRVTPVADIMTPDVLYCFDDQDVEAAATLMSGEQVRRLLVLDRDSNLAGIVSLCDLALETRDRAMTASVLECVSQPAVGAKRHYPRRRA